IQLVDQRHQGLGDEAAAVGAEAALGVGPGVGAGQRGVHRRTLARGSGGNQADLAASRKAAIRTGSLTPGALSTPEETSTAGAPVIRAASARLSGDRPPARNHGRSKRRPASRVQSKLAPTPPG